MKTQTFKELYQELIIRWGEDWETAEIETESRLNNDINERQYSVQFSETENDWIIWNKNGVIYENGTWATRKLTEAPKNWVVEKDENHPLWERFIAWYNRDKDAPAVNGDYLSYCAETEHRTKGERLQDFKGFQYITLDQWAEFFLNEPKAGELHLFHDGDGEFSIAKFKEMNTRKGKEIYPFVDEHDHVWKYCDALSDEAQAILNREIKNIKIK